MILFTITKFVKEKRRRYYRNLSQRRTRASDPVLEATSSTSDAFDRLTLFASVNSHNSFNEYASVNTAECPPPAANFLTSPTHLHFTNKSSRYPLFIIDNLAIKKINIYLRYDSYNIPINWRRIPRVSGFLISSLTVAIITPSVNSPFLGANKCVGVTTADEPHSIRDHQNGYVPEHGFGPVRRARKVSGLWAQA